MFSTVKYSWTTKIIVFQVLIYLQKWMKINTFKCSTVAQSVFTVISLIHIFVVYMILHQSNVQIHFSNPNYQFKIRKKIMPYEFQNVCLSFLHVLFFYSFLSQTTWLTNKMVFVSMQSFWLNKTIGRIFVVFGYLIEIHGNRINKNLVNI